ncbi:nucleotide-binding universal stress UspA family protein [Cryobacterium sp. MP_M5]|uniref:universal stress protein n=1 Tax=unclassified Cryobacterium TaxID=2649013 RepID=UPI0018CB5645|nr:MULTISPECIES: universal stress protein [unclassified Cryobacterium]MBG6059325.1 nucleotide-binding universal stress UspA family protein [Cryobacterium sp. MP_M3]MEC5177827.1 nucleotide-binding universal stress UspA family protein [Cryobacterium sp. MP_M5]
MTTCYVGADGSGPSRAAIRWALSRAVGESSPVVLIHVVDDEWGLLGAGYAAEAERRARDLLDVELAEAGRRYPGADVGARIVHGSPAWTLAGLPSADDLLVVGTHKTGFLHGRVLGSRSVQVAAAAPCSVAVVPDTTFDTRRGVVVGVDRFDGSAAAVVRGAREAARLGQELLLVHAPPVSHVLPSSDLPESTGSAQRLLADAADRAAQAAPLITVRRRLVHREPAEALLDAGNGASLLVLGVAHPHAVTQSVVGSVTHDVLMNITVPVLVARA